MIKPTKFFLLSVVIMVATSIHSAEPCITDDDCSGADACVGGGCVPPVADPDTYAADAALRWTSDWWMVQYPELFVPDEDCCIDYNGDGYADDAYGDLLALMVFTIGIYGSDVLDEVELYFEQGNVVDLMDWRELDPALAAGDVQVSAFGGELVDPGSLTFEDRKAGLGHVLLERDDFGTHGAFNQLNAGTIVGGTATVTGNFVSVPTIFLPVPVTTVSTLHDPQLEAPVVADAAGCSGLCTVDENRGGGHEPPIVGGARLGGLLPADEIFGPMDSYYRQCSCAGIDPTQPVLQWGPSGDRIVASCTANIGDWTLCGMEDCGNSLAWLCILIGYYDDFFDVDSDDDGIRESMTAGFRVGFAGTTIDGVNGMPSVVFTDGFEDGTTGGWSDEEP